MDGWIDARMDGWVDTWVQGCRDGWRGGWGIVLVLEEVSEAGSLHRTGQGRRQEGSMGEVELSAQARRKLQIASDGLS